MSTHTRTELLERLENQLIPFWKNLRDERGGYYGLLDYHLKLDKDADKGCILNSRILWFFSTAAQLLQRDDLLDEARHAYHFLRDCCIDRECGGVYWSMMAQGAPADDTKHTYNQAFAIYGLSAYYRASGDEEALALARNLFALIETRFRDKDGYLEAFTRDFQPTGNEKLSENGVVAYRTMNTLLHVFEGYAGLYAASGDESAAMAMRGILDIWLAHVYSSKRQRQEVFFDAAYNSLIDLHSYGHDIEASWLLDWGTQLLGDDALSARVAEANSSLAENVYRLAWHDDSLWNENERGIPDEKRVWWVQAETVLGFFNEYLKHPEKAYMLEAARKTLDYIHRVTVDSRTGEWFSEVDKSGVPDPKKPMVDQWKCPYHNGRMYLELLRRSFDAQ